MYNLVPTDTNSVNHNINLNEYNDLPHRAINEVLNDTLKKIAKVTGLSQIESVDLLHAQLSQNKQRKVRSDKLHVRKNIKVTLVARTKNSFIYSLFI